MNNFNENNYYDNEIDLLKIVNIFWINKFKIITSMFLVSCISILVSYFVPDKYESSILLVEAESSSGSSQLSELSGLAGIAGIPLPTGETNNAELGIEIFQSRKFTSDFIERRDILIPLFASSGWNKSTKELVIDNNIYNESKNKWNWSSSYSESKKPQRNEAYDYWTKEIFSINEDKKTGFVRISIKHYSPYLASNWAEWIVEDLNNYIREIDVKEAELALEFLNNELLKDHPKELKELFYKLVQANIEKKMLAYSQSEYVFKVVDPSYVPDKRISPKRFIYAFIGVILGMIIGLILSAIPRK